MDGREPVPIAAELGCEGNNPVVDLWDFVLFSLSWLQDVGQNFNGNTFVVSTNYCY